LLKDKSARPTEGDDEEKKLLKERCVAAETMVQVNLDYYKRGTRPITLLLEAMEQLRKARLELRPKPEEQIAILEAYFELTKYEEQRAEDRYKIGASGKDVVAAARYARLTAQLQLLRAKRKRKSAGSK